MPAVRLNRRFEAQASDSSNPLPSLLHTPVGLAIIEIQGTIHGPQQDEALTIGQLEFPNLNASEDNGKEGPWMKRVYLYIGQHQRLVGEVKKLPKPMVVLKKQEEHAKGDSETSTDPCEVSDELDMIAIVKYKLLFSSRPEPVGL